MYQFESDLQMILLALLKYPFYPLFNFDNGMNLISESLTILTSAQLLVVFTFAHIFWRTSFLQVFDQFWSMKWRGPRSRDDTKNYEGQSPNKGRTKAHVDSKPIHAHPSSKRAQRTEPTKMRSRYFGIKQSK